MIEDLWRVVERRLEPDDWRRRDELLRRIAEVRHDARNVAGASRGSRAALEVGRLAAEAVDGMVGAWIERLDTEIARGRHVWTPELRDFLRQRLEQRVRRWSDTVSADLDQRDGSAHHANGPLWTSRDRNIQVIEAALDARVFAADVRRRPLLEKLKAPRYRRAFAAWTEVEDLLDHPAEAGRRAFAAAEEVARIVTGRDSATLGDLLNHLRDAGRIDPTVAKAGHAAWGWTSNNLRHGAKAPAEVDPVKAQWAVRQAEALIHVLLECDGPQPERQPGPTA